MGKFLEIYNLMKLSKDEIEYLKSSIACKKNKICKKILS